MAEAARGLEPEGCLGRRGPTARILVLLIFFAGQRKGYPLNANRVQTVIFLTFLFFAASFIKYEEHVA